MSSPVTDGEQWSDETDASPQGLGYAPLDYQVLEGDQEEEDFANGDEETAEEDAATSQHPDVRGREEAREGY